MKKEKLYGGFPLDEIRQSPRNFGEVSVIEDLSDHVLALGLSETALRAENDRLRYLLASSEARCVYCGLAAADMSKCKSGFPGCGRMDDLMCGPKGEQNEQDV